jgi:hypothetical protein
MEVDIADDWCFLRLLASAALDPVGNNLRPQQLLPPWQLLILADFVSHSFLEPDKSRENRRKVTAEIHFGDIGD